MGIMKVPHQRRRIEQESEDVGGGGSQVGAVSHSGELAE